MFLVITLMVKPRIIYDIYDNILGRFVLIAIIIFLTTHNVTVGLLAALCLIISSNMFFTEGLENMEDTTGVTIGDDNAVNTVSSDKKIIVTSKVMNEGTTTDGAKISELKSQLQSVAEENGIDRQTVEESIRSKSSKSLPVNNSSQTSTDVQPNEPTTTESFSSMY